TAQVHVARWTMRGEDFKYIETDQFIVNPPVFTLQPGQKQLVRLSLRSEAGVEIEGSYRLILEEVPKSIQPGAIAMLLKVSIPVFVLPAQPVMPHLIWQASYNSTGDLKLSVRNDGTAHDRISSVAIQPGNGPAGAAVPTTISGYLLPGDSRDFVITDERLRNARHIALDVVTETAKSHVELTPTERRE
ncbi:MAG TPA: fimbria/pilus periplasmic chaperone, partial [Terriglobia bacterium]|nr:fimbria/pilus periplasmic chaperone [Terriglobia bacterium]